jgi:hypothetical protein
VAGKHGPNRYADYQSIHETVIARLKDEGFVLKENLAFRPLGDGVVFLGAEPKDEDEAPKPGVIECEGGLRLTVEKYIDVLDGDDANAIVQTRRYSYTASVSRVSGLFVFRYCAPHAEPGDNDDAPHHFAYHKHSCDILGDGRETIELLDDEEKRPTLGQVLEELRHWFHANYAAVETLRSATL